MMLSLPLQRKESMGQNGPRKFFNDGHVYDHYHDNHRNTRIHDDVYDDLPN